MNSFFPFIYESEKNKKQKQKEAEHLYIEIEAPRFEEKECPEEETPRIIIIEL